MRTFILSALSMIVAVVTSCAQGKGAGEAAKDTKVERRVLVAYFSATGTTERVAGTIARVTGATLHEIVPEKRYSAADLDWTDSHSRCSVENSDAASRPPIVADTLDMDSYDVIFIGYPIWWNMVPRVVNTFIEKHDLKGRTVIPFATSGGSGISGSVSNLRGLYSDIKWRDGKLLNRTSEKSIRDWAEKELR
ncbi:MAG: flavodoxin [Prevotellaceae bacterium]|nr:flavodoxin [Prevotellaceae bacterium]MDO4931051.1 flavodoxin [Prevotellaceae bacterium]